MLKLIVSKPRSMAGIDVSHYQELIDKEIDKGHTLCVIQYLHGVVEKKMGYDITVCLNAEECGDFDRNLYKEGIYETEIVDYPNKCTAFLWNSNNKPRGLVVDNEDKEAYKYAKRKYDSKEDNL